MPDEVTTIHIKYNGYDRELDEALKGVLSKRDFELVGTGFDLVDEQRDLSFELAKPEVTESRLDTGGSCV